MLVNKCIRFFPSKATKFDYITISIKPLRPLYLCDILIRFQATFLQVDVFNFVNDGWPASRLWLLTSDKSEVSVLTGFVAKWSPSAWRGRKEELDQVREDGSPCPIKPRRKCGQRDAFKGWILAFVFCSNKSCLISEQILLVSTTGNQRSVNICYYLLITRPSRLMAVLKYPRRWRGAAWNDRPLPFVNGLQIKKRETTKLKRQTSEARWSSI